jgi:dihydrofolate synthase/folylpolyglutamate synthase
VFTQPANPRAVPPAALADLAGTLPVEFEVEPRRALSRAREIAGEQGAVLVTGSIYLVADLLSAPGARRASVL